MEKKQTITAQEMGALDRQAQLMLGNEAVAQGAWEAGVKVVSSYPGTPSTEITESVAKFPEVNVQWAPNEKVAAEVAFGAAMAGARAMTCMKHVGVNVAADPIFTAAYTGVNGGLVICCADDPAMHSSQNEQDSRYYARAAHIPMLEPADSQECLDFAKLAFQLSEELDTPVFLRLTTRIAHARSVVVTGKRAEIPLKPYKKDPMKYVMMPGMARKRHLQVEKREVFLAEAVNQMPINVMTLREPSIGIITSGASYQYVRDALPNASTLKLGMVYPLPMKLIASFAAKVERLIVIEELEGLIEKDVRAAGIACEGKNLTGIQGELSVERVQNAVLGSAMPEADAGDLPARPPVLCSGCPHRGVFYVINRLGLRVMGDIGCYTLAALPPLSAMDACLCMGASIGMASGAERAQGREFSKNTVAVLGDSTFIHSGITALIDAVYNQEAITVLILDNRITGMTGHQQNPASGKEIHGNEAPALDLEKLCMACGVHHVTVVDPFDLKAMEKALREETARDEVSVVIARRPCALLDKTTLPPYIIEGCKNCGACMKLSCPAIERRADHVIINPSLCIGCGMCAQVCPFKAIREGGRAE
ncbi:MAG TPA: indolepyruvate ferredoxin oxidoreductase subunit alpha [Candidatus Limiplasma sp.]|nr:indolepyruvate ferredoxin oxidoreductase subunit alpha [Candidatus Limiplasma sp.]HPS82106.1 indolepyruvate ferredoxin oxidoreductase subunit alpha [Candidatus Limiplasma sp.]